MTYKVIRYFTDLQDNDHPYNTGDVYPRQGMTVTAERIAELSSAENRQHTPLIAPVDEPAAVVTTEETDPEGEPEQLDENDSEAEEKPKRRKRKSETE